MKIAIRIFQGLLGVLLGLLLLIEGWALVQQKVLDRPAPRLWGTSYFPVENEDMAPSLTPGDMALIRELPSYAPGDCVAFYRGGTLYLRRIVGSVGEDWITQGEGLPDADADLLAPGDVLGGVRSALPGAGGAAKVLWSVPGLLGTLVLGILLLKLPDFLLKRSARSGLPRRRDLIDPEADRPAAESDTRPLRPVPGEDLTDSLPDLPDDSFFPPPVAPGPGEKKPSPAPTAPRAPQASQAPRAPQVSQATQTPKVSQAPQATQTPAAPSQRSRGREALRRELAEDEAPAASSVRTRGRESLQREMAGEEEPPAPSGRSRGGGHYVKRH